MFDGFSSSFDQSTGHDRGPFSNRTFLIGPSQFVEKLLSLTHAAAAIGVTTNRAVEQRARSANRQSRVDLLLSRGRHSAGDMGDSREGEIDESFGNRRHRDSASSVNSIGRMARANRSAATRATIDVLLACRDKKRHFISELPRRSRKGRRRGCRGGSGGRCRGHPTGCWR